SPNPTNPHRSLRCHARKTGGPRRPTYLCPDRVTGGETMLRFLGSSHTFCDGVSRRDFLQIGAFGAGLTLADMLRLQSASAANTKQPSRSNKAAIMIYLPGGP